MERELNLGLIKDRHLTQLFLLMEHATETFEEDGAGEFFESIVDVVILENRRRRTGREGEDHTVEWSFDMNELHPVTMMCLLDFFRRKTHQFKDEEPPVATFFNRFKAYLADAVDRHIAPSLQRTIRETQTKIRAEKETTVSEL
jgi:hypothetical protein